jgi:hypothetical protein
MPLAKVRMSGGPAWEVLAGTAPAGLHLVGDPQDAVPVQDSAEGGVEAVGRGGEAADALDGFGDERGNVPGVAEEVLEVGHTGVDEPLVAVLRVRPAGADAAVHVQGL